MIYFLKHLETGLIKIVSLYLRHNRLLKLIVASGEFEALGFMPDDIGQEQNLFRRFAHLSTRDELGGRGWFRPEIEIMEFIDQYTELTLQEQFSPYSGVTALMLWSNA